MIVAIHRSGPSTAGTMRYNGDKVRAGVAEVVAEHGIGSRDIRTIARVLADRELLSLREAEHVSFQMSVNPGPDDAIREEQIPSFVRELMEGLGYGRQPWAVFRHEDTGRRHWHVVSVRVDDKGRKINDFWEKRKCDRLVASLETKYGFTKGAVKAASRPMETSETLPVFRKNSGDTLKSIEACVRHSLGYRFTTRRQFAEILRCHGVQVQEGLGKDDLKVYLSFQGLDETGRPCTGSVSETRLSLAVSDSLTHRLAECAGQDTLAERSALRSEMSSALNASPDYAAFEGAMRAKGVDVVLYRDGEGVPSAATVIDHRSMCAFKASELSRTLSADILSLAAGRDGGQAQDGVGIGREAAEEKENSEETEGAGAVESAVSFALGAALALLSSGGGKVKLDKKKKRRRI